MPPTLEQRLAARQPDGKASLSMRMGWRCLLFLHWRMDAQMLQEKLPKGLHIDTFDGSAWLAIVPFMMTKVRPKGLPAIPGISDFLELNVRTYVYDNEGVPGVWFFSLDCSSGLAVRIAQKKFKLPYMKARMKTAVADDIHYTCRRDDSYGGQPPGNLRLSVYRYNGVGDERLAEPDSLDFFLMERYYLYAQDGDTIRRAQVIHEPYQIREAEVAPFDTIPICLDDLPLPCTPPDHTCYVDEVDVDAYALQ